MVNHPIHDIQTDGGHETALEYGHPADGAKTAGKYKNANYAERQQSTGPVRNVAAGGDVKNVAGADHLDGDVGHQRGDAGDGGNRAQTGGLETIPEQLGLGEAAVLASVSPDARTQ